MEGCIFEAGKGRSGCLVLEGVGSVLAVWVFGAVKEPGRVVSTMLDLCRPESFIPFPIQKELLRLSF